MSPFYLFIYFLQTASRESKCNLSTAPLTAWPLRSAPDLDSLQTSSISPCLPEVMIIIFKNCHFRVPFLPGLWVAAQFTHACVWPCFLPALAPHFHPLHLSSSTLCGSPTLGPGLSASFFCPKPPPLFPSSPDYSPPPAFGLFCHHHKGAWPPTHNKTSWGWREMGRFKEKETPRSRDEGERRAEKFPSGAGDNKEGWKQMERCLPSLSPSSM